MRDNLPPECDGVLSSLPANALSYASTAAETVKHCIDIVLHSIDSRPGGDVPDLPALALLGEGQLMSLVDLQVDRLLLPGP